MLQTLKKKIVVVGGGTGTFALLRGLKRYADQIDITAVVTMADSGGSTGRLRDEFGYLPVGDVRQALVALAPEYGVEQDLLRQLFLYRYEKGDGLVGHNFGNLFLTALSDITGSEKEAIATAARLLNIAGKVLPVTTAKANLVATYDTGAVVKGEHAIDEQEVCCGERIMELSLEPRVTLEGEVAAALAAAELVVFGPGDLYTSILANCVVDGFADTLTQSNAQLVYVLNLMTKRCQTTGLDGLQHTSEVEKYIGRKVDHIIVNSNKPTLALQKRYQAEGDYLVETSAIRKDKRTIFTNVVSQEIFSNQPGDTLKRSYIRHDGDLLAKILLDLCQ